MADFDCLLVLSGKDKRHGISEIRATGIECKCLLVRGEGLFKVA